MKMSCKHCESLNLLTLLDEIPHNVSDIVKKNAVRYYCNHPDMNIDYCPFTGSKELCDEYHRRVINEKSSADLESLV